MTERVVEKRVEFDAPVERVWRAITEPAELARWFGEEAELDLRPGGDGSMYWPNHGRFPMRVVEVDAPRRLVWRWTHLPDQAFDDAPLSTVVEWTLEEREGGGTVLHLRESGFPSEERRGENDHGWDEELKELVDLLAA